jgi:hypothetical protein
MEKNIVYSWLAAIILLLVSSCTKPIEPENPHQQSDTVSAFVRAVITAPDRQNQIWQIRGRDTLSNGIVGYVRTDGFNGTRNGEIVQSYSDCFHNLNPQNSYINLTITKSSNVIIYDTKTIELSSIISRFDSLRSWDREQLQIIFKAPSSIVVPFYVSSSLVVRSVQWERSKIQERYLPSNGNTWSIRSIYITEFKALYAQTYFSFESHLRSKLDSVAIVIEKYDRNKGYISGKFYVEYTNLMSSEIIRIQNGVFENVKLRAFVD